MEGNPQRSRILDVLNSGEDPEKFIEWKARAAKAAEQRAESHKACRNYKEYAEALITQAELVSSIGHIHEAIKLYRRAAGVRQIDIGDFQGHLDLCGVIAYEYLKNGQRFEAARVRISAGDDCMKIHPPDYDQAYKFYWSAVRICFDENDPSYQSLVEIDTALEALEKTGEVFLRQKFYREAAARYGWTARIAKMNAVPTVHVDGLITISILACLACDDSAIRDIRPIEREEMTPGDPRTVFCEAAVEAALNHDPEMLAGAMTNNNILAVLPPKSGDLVKVMLTDINTRITKQHKSSIVDP